MNKLLLLAKTSTATIFKPPKHRMPSKTPPFDPSL